MWPNFPTSSLFAVSTSAPLSSARNELPRYLLSLHSFFYGQYKNHLSARTLASTSACFVHCAARGRGIIPNIPRPLHSKIIQSNIMPPSLLFRQSLPGVNTSPEKPGWCHASGRLHLYNIQILCIWGQLWKQSTLYLLLTVNVCRGFLLWVSLS